MYATAPNLYNSSEVRNDHPMFERYQRMLVDVDKRLGAGSGYSTGRLYLTTSGHYCLTAVLPGGFKCSILNDVTMADLADLTERAAAKPKLHIKAKQTQREPLRKRHGRELGHDTLTLCKLQMQATAIKEVAKLYGFTFVASEEHVLGFVQYPIPMSFHLEPFEHDGFHLQLI